MEECRTVSSRVLDICESDVEGGESEAVIRVEKVKQCFKRNELVKRVTISKLSLSRFDRSARVDRIVITTIDFSFFSLHKVRKIIVIIIITSLVPD